MKKVIFYSVVLITITSFARAQTAISDFNGIWQSNDDENNFKIMKGGRVLGIYFSEKDIIIIPQTMGFCEDISKKRMDSIGKKFIELLSNEYSPIKTHLCMGDGTSNFIYSFDFLENALVLFGNRDLPFVKVKKLPSNLETSLREECKKKNIDIDYFLGFSKDKRIINIPKSRIYTIPNVASKMFLVQGDEVSVLEEKSGWLHIVYVTAKNKEIKGWIKKEDEVYQLKF
jgi:hypothetical protein